MVVGPSPGITHSSIPGRSEIGLVIAVYAVKLGVITGKTSTYRVSQKSLCKGSGLLLGL